MIEFGSPAALAVIAADRVAALEPEECSACDGYGWIMSASGGMDRRCRPCRGRGRIATYEQWQAYENAKARAEAAACGVALFLEQ